MDKATDDDMDEENQESETEKELWDISRYPTADGIYREIGNSKIDGEAATLIDYMFVPDKYSNVDGSYMYLRFFFAYEGPVSYDGGTSTEVEGKWIHYFTEDELEAINAGTDPNFTPDDKEVWMDGCYESDESDPLAVYEEYASSSVGDFASFYIQMFTCNTQYIIKEIPGVGNIWELRAVIKPGKVFFENSGNGIYHYEFLSPDLSCVGGENGMDIYNSEITLKDGESYKVFTMFGNEEDYANEENLKALQDFAKSMGAKPVDTEK